MLHTLDTFGQFDLVAENLCDGNMWLACVLHDRLDEAKDWLNGLSDSGGCNLLASVKHIYTIKDLETACIVVGSL